MFQRTMHVLLGTTFVVLLGIQGAWAVSFGKVDVASKMGEPFYAEVPLRLNDSETLRKTSVELGSAADYRILEVYRNPVLDSIRTDIVDDERGVRVTLSSAAAIDEAFFNVVLKVRYGRSTHYKKVPVFLDIPSVTATAQAPKKPLVAVNTATVDPTSSSAFTSKVPEGKTLDKKEAFEDIVEPEPEASASNFNAYDGWARTAKYGPMVYGDTITTVAKRLRLDDTFTNKQVMVALFEKNRSQFSNDNINLIKAGSYLDVPTAEEVAVITPSAAKQFLSQQTKAWRAMQKQPKFAAIAEAQRNRYSSRVRIGHTATGTASQPVYAPEMNKPTVAMPANDDSGTDVNKQGVSNPMGEANSSNMAVKVLEKKLIQKDEAFAALQKKLAEVESKFVDAQSNPGAAGGVKATPPEMSADSAALEAQNKRLELVITRLKAQLDKAKTNVSSSVDSSMADWMLYALIALGAIVLALLVAVFLLMRKGREHPAASDPMLEEDFDDETVANSTLDATKVMNADEFEMPAAVPSFAEDSSAEEAADLFGTSGDLEEIPDLTDEETGEIEPFNADEAPDPNVNYLEDADVYLRYGMEDEAEQQVRMALKLEADNPEAHVKMVKVQKAKGDGTALNEAIATAKVALTGNALAVFETAISDEDSILQQSENDVTLEDLPAHVAEEKTNVNDINIGGINFDESADDGEIDFDFSDIGKGKEVAENIAVDTESQGDDLPDLDVDFDIADLGDGEDANETPTEEESGSLMNGKLDEIGVEGTEESDIEEFVDSIGQGLKSNTLDDDDELLGIDSINFGDMDLGETAEVQLGEGTQLVSTDGSDLDMVEGLNNFELDKLKNETEAEKNATAVVIDDESTDPFLDANQALKEKDESEAGEDWDVESIGLLAGEKEDELSLIDEQKEVLNADGTVNIELDDLEMDFDLPDLDADIDTTSDDESDATFIMDAGDAATDADSEQDDDSGLSDVSLGDLGVDTKSSLEDSGLVDLGVISDDENDDLSLLDAGIESLDSLDTGLDDLDISTTTVDPVRFGLDDEGTDLDISMVVDVNESEQDLLADLDADLSELEMHEESILTDVNEFASEASIEDLNIDVQGTSDVMFDEADDLDKTFVLNDVEKNKEMLGEGEKESLHHFDNIDDALSGASSVTDDPMLEPGGITQELENIHTQDPVPLDTISASDELDNLLKDLDGLLDEGKDTT